jgi:hypothetical protein
MRILSYEMPKNWNYFLYGDSHVGAALRHGKGFKKMIKMINSKYAGLPAECNFCTDHGDIIEAIMVDDKRFSIFDSREACILSQLEEVKKELWPIKDRLLTILDGNHPHKLHLFGNLTGHVCKELGVNYGTWTVKLTFKHGEELQFKHLATHGSGSISSVADDPERRKLNWRLSLKRKLRDIAGDCVLMSMGHTHKIIVSPPTKTLYLTDDGKNINQHYHETEDGPYIHPDHRFYINTGGFLKSYSNIVTESNDVPIEESKLGSGYAERAMYPPLPLGFVVVKIRDSKIVGTKVESL